MSGMLCALCVVQRSVVPEQLLNMRTIPIIGCMRPLPAIHPRPTAGMAVRQQHFGNGSVQLVVS